MEIEMGSRNHHALLGAKIEDLKTMLARKFIWRPFSWAISIVILRRPQQRVGSQVKRLVVTHGSSTNTDVLHEALDTYRPILAEHGLDVGLSFRVQPNLFLRHYRDNWRL